MYERIKMSWWGRFWGRDRFIEDDEYRYLSEREKKRFKQVAPIPQLKTPVSWPSGGTNISPGYRSESERSSRRDEDYTPPIMPDLSSYDSGLSSNYGNDDSPSDSGSSFDFGGGDGGGGGASGDY